MNANDNRTWTPADTLTPELVEAMNHALETIPGDFYLVHTARAWASVQRYLEDARAAMAANDRRAAYEWTGPLVVGAGNLRPWGPAGVTAALVVAVRDALHLEANAISWWAQTGRTRAA
jgi:hypothetical protein